jgi:hypothetical protein
MAVKVIRRKGIDDAEVVAVWEEGRGFVEGTARFTEDPRFAEYDEEQVIGHFDGPDYFAVPFDGTRQKSLTSANSNMGFDAAEGSDSGRVYIDRVSEAPEDAIVHADGEENLFYEP